MSEPSWMIGRPGIESVEDVYFRRFKRASPNLIRKAFGGTAAIYMREEEDTVVIGTFRGKEVTLSKSAFESEAIDFFGPHIPRVPLDG